MLGPASVGQRLPDAIPGSLTLKTWPRETLVDLLAQYRARDCIPPRATNQTCIAAACYRLPGDKYAAAPKARFPREEIVQHV